MDSNVGNNNDNNKTKKKVVAFKSDCLLTASTKIQFWYYFQTFHDPLLSTTHE